MAAESWELGQRAQFYGEPDHGVPFDVQKYGTDDSLITTNVDLDFDWMRGRLAELGAPGRPALCSHVSDWFVWNGNAAPGSRFERYQEAMRPYLLTAGPGLTLNDNLVPYPNEPGWALDPESPGVWEAMVNFWDKEIWYRVEEVVPGQSRREAAGTQDGPVGIYFDNAHDLVWDHWRQMVPGITDDQLRAKQRAWQEGTEWMVRELRRRWGNSIILTANFAHYAKFRKCPYLDVLNGITTERWPATPQDWWMFIVQKIQSARYRRGRTYSCAWHLNGPSPIPGLFRPGSHWSQRNANE